MSFRDSDFNPPKLHPSYSYKPTPTIQLQNQHSRLEENKKNTWATTSDVMPEPIRASQTEYYDPSHPDADWSGFVRYKDGQRHHVRGHRSQNTGIVQTEQGIISKDEKAEWAKKNRHHNPEAKDTSSILGGVLDPDHDPYMTDAKRAAMGLGTSRAQMTLMKQQMVRTTEHHHGVPGSRPPSTMAKENQMVLNAPCQPVFTPSVSAKGTSRSLLSNLGADLLDCVPPASKSSSQPGHNPNPRSVYRPK
jgi:hypothetical protein